MAALEVDSLARRFGRYQDLDLTVPELLLGVKTRAHLIPRAGPHAAVDGAYTEAPGLQPLYQVVEGVL